MNRNGPSPMSPVSFQSGSDWSPLNNYQNHDGPYPQPTGSYGNKPNLITPPASGHSSAETDGGMSRPGPRRPSNGHPSPPNSVGRSSMASQQDSRRIYMMEEALGEHYALLRRYLAPSLRDPRAASLQNRARDKLQRLSPVQFQELSTDVYDELQRRQDEEANGGRGAPGNNTPEYLLPRNNFHFKRNQARQKLSTLPRDRFRQLATDVFFELERRVPRFVGDRPMSSASSMRGGSRPPPSARSRTPNGYGPPGSRPGSMPFRPPRGTSLASNGTSAGGAPPMPKTFQSNTIIPNKGTMVEDDDDDDDNVSPGSVNGMLNGAVREVSPPTNGNVSDKMAAEQREKIQELEDQLAKANDQLRSKDQELDEMRQNSREKEMNAGPSKAEFERLQQELQGKVSQAQEMNDKLRNELDRIRREKEEGEEQFRRETDNARKDADVQIEAALQQARTAQQEARTAQQEARATQQEAQNMVPSGDLQRRYESMQDELAEQQRITDEVRHETAQYLTEMRAMSENSMVSLEKEEKLTAHVAGLERELKEWKGRYARAKTQLRSLHASSAGLSIGPPDVGTPASAFLDAHGLVRDVHLIRYQISIDELLQAARRPEAGAVLDALKPVVEQVRNITSGVEGSTGDRRAVSERGSGDADGADPVKQQSRLKARVAATANNIITAAKNHAAAQGLSPLSLIDAAASHLTNAIVELVKLVKVRPTPANELDADEAQLPPLNSGVGAPRRSYGGMNGLRMHTSKSSAGGASSYSAASFSSSSPRRGELLSSRTSEGGNSPHQPSLKSTPPMPHYQQHQYQQQQQQQQQPVGLGVQMLRQDSIGGSGSGSGSGGLMASGTLDGYKSYLEDQTALLVQNIQPLVNTIRSGASSAQAVAAINGYVAEISQAIRDVRAETERTVHETGNRALERHTPAVIEVLEQCRRGLVEKAERGERGRDEMPPVAFRIARATKELVLRVDRIEEGKLTADMSYPLEM